jgi:hypothetical protein
MTIHVPIVGGTKAVEAHETGIPGLVYHRETESRKRGYSITHAKSGYAVLIGVPTKAKVKTAIERLKAIPLDWTLSRSKLRPKAKQYIHEVRQIARELEA